MILSHYIIYSYLKEKKKSKNNEKQPCEHVNTKIWEEGGKRVSSRTRAEILL